MKAIFLLLTLGCHQALTAQSSNHALQMHGAFVRSDSTKKQVALVFTADEFGEGLQPITTALKKAKVKAGFFFTGRFYRNPAFGLAIKNLQADGHYLGPHSDAHLLYCDWQRRDSLLVSRHSFDRDLAANVQAMKALRLPIRSPHLFIPPFEWWNDSIAAWSRKQGFQLLNFSPGMRTAADYTWPEMGTAYKGSEWILAWLQTTIRETPQRLNGAVLLIHAGTDPRRKDKLYDKLDELIQDLKANGFQLKRIDDLLPRN